MSVEDRSEITAHLAVCLSCREQLEQERWLTEQLRVGECFEPSRKSWGARARVAAALVLAAAVPFLLLVASSNGEACGSIKSSVVRGPSVSWQDGDIERLDVSNHIEIPAGASAVITLNDVGFVHGVGPVVCELDRTPKRWKLTLHCGSVEVTIAAGAELAVASSLGQLTLCEGKHLVEVTAAFFGGVTSKGTSTARLLRQGLTLFFDQQRMDDAARLFERVLDQEEATPEQRSQALFYGAAALSNAHRYSEAGNWARRYLEESNDDNGRDVALFIVGKSQWYGAEPATAWDQILREIPESGYTGHIHDLRQRGRTLPPKPSGR